MGSDGDAGLCSWPTSTPLAGMSKTKAGPPQGSTTHGPQTGDANMYIVQSTSFIANTVQASYNDWKKITKLNFPCIYLSKVSDGVSC